MQGPLEKTHFEKCVLLYIAIQNYFDFFSYNDSKVCLSSSTKDPALNTLRFAPGGYCFRNIFCILNRAYMKKNDNGAVKTLIFCIFWREQDNM